MALRAGIFISLSDISLDVQDRECSDDTSIEGYVRRVLRRLAGGAPSHLPKASADPKASVASLHWNGAWPYYRKGGGVTVEFNDAGPSRELEGDQHEAHQILAQGKYNSFNNSIWRMLDSETDGPLTCNETQGEYPCGRKAFLTEERCHELSQLRVQLSCEVKDIRRHDWMEVANILLNDGAEFGQILLAVGYRYPLDLSRREHDRWLAGVQEKLSETGLNSRGISLVFEPT